MKPIQTVLFTAAFLLLTPLVHAAVPSATYYAITISASFSTQVGSGTSATLHASAVNNKKILQSVFESGSNGGVSKASDLDLVLNPANNDFAVIVKATSVVVDVLGTITSNSFDNYVTTYGKSGQFKAGALTGYNFTLPDSTQPQVINAFLKETIDPSTGALRKYTLTFNGGQGLGTAGSNLFVGTVRKATKVYTASF